MGTNRANRAKIVNEDTVASVEEATKSLGMKDISGKPAVYYRDKMRKAKEDLFTTKGEIELLETELTSKEGKERSRKREENVQQAISKVKGVEDSL